MLTTAQNPVPAKLQFEKKQIFNGFFVNKTNIFWRGGERITKLKYSAFPELF
jgi:hypothetical protein